MNNETDINSVLKSSTVSCITIEDDSDEIEVIDLDDEIENDVKTYSFHENNASNTFIDILDTQSNIEDNNLHPLDDPLVTESNENNEEKTKDNNDIDDEDNNDVDEDNDCENDANQFKSRISLCLHKCYLKVSEIDRKEAYNEFRTRKTQDLKFQLMNELIETEFKTTSNRHYSRFFLSTRAERKNVCKMCFMCCMHMTRDFLNLYFRYKFKYSKQMKKANCAVNNSGSNEEFNELKNLVTTINIIDEENLDEDDTALREKILKLGWMRIPDCKNMCSTGVSKEEQKKIFVSYWFKSTREERYKFISDMTDVSYKNSKITFSYHLYTNMGIVNVCRSCFSIALNEQHSFIHQALQIKCFKLQLSNTIEISKNETSEKIIDLDMEINQEDKKELTDKNNHELKIIDMEKELKDINEKNDDNDDNNEEDNFDDIFETMENLKYACVNNYLEDKYNIRLSARGCGCYLNITRDTSKRSFYLFWNKKLTSRINYIIELTELPKNSWKIPKLALQRAKFLFFSTRGKPRRICKICFLSVLDISKIFLDSVVEEKIKRVRENVTYVKQVVEESRNFQTILKNDKVIESKLSKGWRRLENCKHNCVTRISVNDQENIFNSYWLNSTPESRYEFIDSMVVSVKKKKVFWNAFYLNTSKGRERVCRSCFRLVINESQVFMLDALQRKPRIVEPELEFNENHLQNVNATEFEIDDNNCHSTTSVNNDNEDDGDDNEDDVEVDIEDDNEDDNDDDNYNNENEDNDDSTITKRFHQPPFEILLNEWTPLKPCSRGCNLLITDDRQKEIFVSYWKDTTNKMRTKFILEMVDVKPTLSYRSHTPSNRRYHTFFYFYVNTTMRMQKVCKLCFKTVLLISHSFIKKILDDIYFSIIVKSKNKNENNDDDDDDDYDDYNSTLISQHLQPEHNEETMNKMYYLNEKFCKCPTKQRHNWSPLLPCINNCHLKLTDNEQRNIFLTYWEKKSFDSRFNFINGRTELILHENCDKLNKMIFRTGYYFVTHQGRQKFCKYCFYHILDVSETFMSAIFHQKLYKMIELSIIPLNSNMTFVFYEDEILQPRTLETNEMENQITCDNCIAHCEIKMRQGVSLLKNCYKKCCKKLTKNDRNRIFYDYYCQDKSIDAREKFICDMIKNITISFNKKTNCVDDYNYENKMEFCLHTENGIVTICQSCFTRLINESFEFIVNTVKNKMNKYGVQLKLKNKQMISSSSCQKQKKIKSDESKLESAVNHVEQIMVLNSFVKNDDNEFEDNDSLNVKQEVIENTNLNPISINEVVLKMECTDEINIPDEDVEMKSNSENNANQENVNETNFSNYCIAKMESQEEDTVTDKKEELEIFNLKSNSSQESIKIKTECEEENNILDKDSKSPLNQLTESSLSPLKRKSSQISIENNEPFLGLSIIKEEVDLENDIELETEKYTGPPEKIAKIISNNNSNINNTKEQLNIQIPTIKQEPKTKEQKTNEKNETTNKPKKKRVTKKKIDKEELKLMPRMKIPIVNFRLKSRREKFIEQELEKILQKYGKETVIEKNILSTCEDPSEDDIKKFHEHLNKFPLCESYHYNDKSLEKYLPMGLTTKIMYDLYKQEMTQPISNIWYNKLLEKTNLKFRSSFLTKCNVCSAAAIQYKVARDLSEKSKINSHRTAHLIDSEEANNEQSLDESNTKNEKQLLVCSFGFQQSLPTPYLTEPNSYYKQRLWTYNFTIRNQCSKKDEKVRKFYLWNENEGKRTINEIASCLYLYLKNLPSRITKVIFYSTCNEDTMSKNLAAMFLYSVINHEQLESVEHKFLIAGHSQIEVNLGSKNVQEIINYHQNKIHEPNDWYVAFRKYMQDSECEIKTRNNFYNFNIIRDEIFPNNHEFINEKNVKCLRYTKQGIFYKTGWSSTNRFQMINLNDSLQHLRTMKLEILPRASISEEKKMDLLSLIPFLRAKTDNFYKQLLYDELDLKNSEITEKCQKTSGSTNEKCEEIKTKKKKENSMVKNKKCDENDDIEEICIIENKIQREEKTTNKFELVLIKEEEFE